MTKTKYIQVTVKTGEKPPFGVKKQAAPAGKSFQGSLFTGLIYSSILTIRKSDTFSVTWPSELVKIPIPQITWQNYSCTVCKNYHCEPGYCMEYWHIPLQQSGFHYTGTEGWQIP